MTKKELVELLAPYPDETNIMMVVGVYCDENDVDDVVTIRSPEGDERSRVIPNTPTVVLSN